MILVEVLLGTVGGVVISWCVYKLVTVLDDWCFIRKLDKQRKLDEERREKKQ